MWTRVKSLSGKYKEIIAYLFFGVLTTAVNFLCYLGLTRPLGQPVGRSTALAWVASVLFAYCTNRRWVFHSRAAGLGPVLREATGFLGARLFSGVMDWGVMLALAEGAGWDDRAVKLLSNALVILVNYLLSKLLIFRKPVDKSGSAM